MKKKLLFTFVSAAMVSFAAYCSLQGNEDVSLSDLAIENAEALADDVNPLCPDGHRRSENLFGWSGDREEYLLKHLCGAACGQFLLESYFL